MASATLTFVANAGDGSGLLYALEQPGRIRIINPDGSVAPEPLLDIHDRVKAGGEQGLLGLAFDPDFATNGRFFVDYTDNRGNTTLSEFIRAPDGTVDAAAERILLTVNQPFSNHNGGMLAFGPDGYLYIGLGDGGSGGDPHGNGQNVGVLLGKILRIDVDAGDSYAIPADNPFADAGNGVRAEIWDYGLRNPWRFSFDTVSGALFIADVGQDEWEEVDVEAPGDGGHNYGWNILEGTHCYASSSCPKAGTTPPVATYSHQQGCSISGGYVYRGAAYPQLYGGYVYADYCSGTVWAFDADAALRSGNADPVQMGKFSFGPSAFGQDEAGELYVVDHSGAIYRLTATPR